MSTTIRRRVAGLAMAGAAAITLTACGNTTTDDTSAGPALPSVQNEEANASADAEASAAAATTSGPKTNQRGNIVKTLGEEGGLTSEDGRTLYTFAIDSISPDVPCTEEYSSYDPENGHITAVQMRLATQAFTPDDFSYLTVSSSDFSFIGSDGLTFTNVDTMATYGCIADSKKFPSSDLQPGSQYAGIVLLDLPEASGTLIYRPSSVYNGGGWEISY
jgi:hypothetical protein